jgi:hypothetical protein
VTAAFTLDVLAPASDTRPQIARPPLRLTPAPDVEVPFDSVPFDNETSVSHLPPGQDTLPLPFESGHVAPVLRLVPTDAPAVGAPVEAIAPPSLPARPPALLPRPDARVLVQALCEVLSGTRPAVQLATSVSPSVLAALRSSAGIGPWRSPDGGVGPRPAVRSVHVQETIDGVLDVCAVVRRGSRHHALALRMRRRRTRWEATTVQVG